MGSRLKPTDPPFGFLFPQLQFKESLALSAIQTNDSAASLVAAKRKQSDNPAKLFRRSRWTTLSCSSPRTSPTLSQPLNGDSTHASADRIRAELDGRPLRVHRSEDSPRCRGDDVWRRLRVAVPVVLGKRSTVSRPVRQGVAVERFAGSVGAGCGNRHCRSHTSGRVVGHSGQGGSSRSNDLQTRDRLVPVGIKPFAVRLSTAHGDDGRHWGHGSPDAARSREAGWDGPAWSLPDGRSSVAGSDWRNRRAAASVDGATSSSYCD